MRLPGKGRNAGAEEVRFRFDGRDYRGRVGEPLAAALMAQGVRVMGRSFKYHRPRGVMTAGSEEPNALVTVGRGPGREPNVRATVQEVFEGLEAASQNAWPSVEFDLMAVNDLFAPFLGAGFYYKTFMWPRRFWERLYEPAIRRAAGLGALSGEHNPDRYEKAFAFCDLLVIGAGPAGLMAALAAGRAGAEVILADEGAEPGGRLLSEDETVAGQPAHVWVAAVMAE
uniref:2Fe-2S iron-sulfur cluster-binding protein n=1 Tax=Rhodosalinus sp. TaxID=2047741 RepID=UPI003562AC8D